MKVIKFIQNFDKGAKIGVNVRICLANKQDNFHLHRFTTSENITKKFGVGHFFDSHFGYNLYFRKMGDIEWFQQRITTKQLYGRRRYKLDAIYK